MDDGTEMRVEVRALGSPRVLAVSPLTSNGGRKNRIHEFIAIVQHFDFIAIDRNLANGQILTGGDSSNARAHFRLVRTVEAHAGKLENKVQEPGMTVAKRRYWITL